MEAALLSLIARLERGLQGLEAENAALRAQLEAKFDAARPVAEES